MTNYWIINKDNWGELDIWEVIASNRKDAICEFKANIKNGDCAILLNKRELLILIKLIMNNVDFIGEKN